VNVVTFVAVMVACGLLGVFIGRNKDVPTALAFFAGLWGIIGWGLLLVAPRKPPDQKRETLRDLTQIPIDLTRASVDATKAGGFYFLLWLRVMCGAIMMLGFLFTFGGVLVLLSGDTTYVAQAVAGPLLMLAGYLGGSAVGAAMDHGPS
jgi:hypothetical protein